MAKKFNLIFLNEIIKRDSATLQGVYENLTRNSDITFICKCGNQYTKNFRLMHISSGAFCRSCTVTNRRIKLEKTCLERFGAINVFVNETIKSKIKDTYINTYNVVHPSQIASVKDKKKQLSIDKFGVENVFQAEEIKNMMKETSRRKYNCDFPSQNASVRAKMKDTLLARYGVEFPLQSTV